MTIGHAPRDGAATTNGKETVLGTVMMLVGQNSRDVARRVGAQVPNLRAALPKGMITSGSVRSFRDWWIAPSRRSSWNLGEGALLVALSYLLIVVGNWRAGIYRRVGHPAGLSR